MSLTALLELRLEPDMLDAAHSTLREILADTRRFPGCEGVDVLVDRDDRAHIVVHERWASTEADAAYRAWRAREGASDLGSVLTGAPVLTVLSTEYSL
jgi:quinol monooxygenase YgiN